MAEQDFTEIARLAERYSKEPKSRIFVQLADAYRKNNMVDEALEVLKQGLQYHPQYPLAFLILGKCYFDKRMYAQSKDALEKTIEFDPINIVALRMLAQVCETLKDEACQLRAYKGIVSVDPSDEMARGKLKTLESGQRKGQVYTITLAQEYEKQGNLQEALNVYEQLGFVDPTDLVIKQKIKELRDKISGVIKEVKREEEKKVAELKLENYFQPEEISVVPPSVEVPKPPDSALGEHIIDLEKQIELPTVEEVKPEPVVEMKEPKKVEEPEEILSLEEFLVKPSAPVEEIKPEPIIEEPVQPSVIEETPEEKVSSGIILEKPVEQPVVEEKVSEKEPEMIPEPEPEASIQELIERPVETEVPPPAEPVKEVIAEPPVERIQEVAAPEPVEKPAEEKPAPAEEEKKKEEPPKPKEEDFKSFQDWLSSLLK